MEKNEAAVDERPPSIVYGPATPIPLTMTFSELLDHHAKVRGDRPAVVSHPQQGRVVSFRQLQERSMQLARAMAKGGIGNGDLVAISLGSRIEYFETFFACTRLGAALVLLNYAYAESEMLALLKIVRESDFYISNAFVALLTGDRPKDVGSFTWIYLLR